MSPGNFWDDSYIAVRRRLDINWNTCVSSIKTGPSLEELIKACGRHKPVKFELEDSVPPGNLLPARSYLVRIDKLILTRGLEIEGILYLDQPGKFGYNFRGYYYDAAEAVGSVEWADASRIYTVVNGFKKILKSAA